MIFYDEARDDGLQKRIETPSSIEEHFVNRDDFLYYRSVDFGKRPKKFGPAETLIPRPIIVSEDFSQLHTGRVVYYVIFCILL